MWAGGKGSCSVCVDLQAVGALEFFGELYSLAKGFGPIFEGVWAGFREREGSIFSNHQHFAVSTGICGVACPLPASRVDKPLLLFIFRGQRSDATIFTGVKLGYKRRVKGKTGTIQVKKSENEQKKVSLFIYGCTNAYS